MRHRRPFPQSVATLRALTILSVLALTFSVAAAHGPRADLSRLVVVGDSLSAGYQNGSLLGTQQVNGYAALVARQAGVSLPLPLIAAPGIPNVLTLVDPGPPPVIGMAPGVSTGRLDPTLQPMDLAVPGATVQDALATRPDPAFDDFTDLVLGLPGLLGGISASQVEWAEMLAPTTVIVWLGANDTLLPAASGDATGVTPVADFRQAYAEVMTRLAATGAALVVANLPDVGVLPYFLTAEEVAGLSGLPLTVVGPVLGLAEGDLVTPDALPLIGPVLTGAVPGPLPPQVILDAGEQQVIRIRTDAFNRIIAGEARRVGAALVDVHGLLAWAKARGIVVGGQRLTTDFLGGLFSLDGIHPTNTGYAIIANAFIQAMNARLHAGIPPVNVGAIERVDPLVPPGHGHAAALHRGRPWATVAP